MKMLEARVRIELTNNGFADHSLPTWVPRLCKRLECLEARVGIEPTSNGFADHCLTTWLSRLSKNYAQNLCPTLCPPHPIFAYYPHLASR
jgi:hypothetical protein